MATKFSDFTAQAATGTTFVVGYDGTTNTQYSQDNLTNFVLDGTLTAARTLKLDGNNLTINYGTGSVFPTISANKFTLYPNGNSNAVSTRAAYLTGNIDFNYLGHNANSIGLNFTSYNTSIRAYGFSFYGGGAFSNNGGYSVIGPDFTYTSGNALTARLGIIGKGNTGATYGLRVQNSDNEDAFYVRDDKYTVITVNNGIENGFILKNEATYTMLDAGDDGPNSAQMRMYDNSSVRFYFKASQGLMVADTGNNGSSGASSVLTATSNTRGFLPPRNADPASNITTPVAGLVAYDTTDNELQFYNGTSWNSAGGGGDNIYTADGTLSGNRTVTMGSNSLSFNSTQISSGGQVSIPSGGRFIINSFSTELRRNFLKLYSGAGPCLTGTVTGFCTISSFGSADPSATYSINARLGVVGKSSTSTTDYAFRVQDSASADMLSVRDDGAIAIGKSASCTSSAPNTSVIIGTSALATSNNSVVIGKSATTGFGGDHNVLLGADTSVANNTNFGIAIGRYAASNTNGIAIGYSSAVGGNGIAIGRDAEATGGKSITLSASGAVSQNTTANSFAVYMSDATTPDFRVIGAEGMIPPSITTTVRDAISSPNSGSTIYNTTDNKLQFYNGTAWTDAGGGGGNIYTTDGTLSGNRTVTMGTNTLSFNSSSAASANTVFTFNGTYTSTAGGTGTSGGGFEVAGGYGTKLKPTYLQIYSGATIQGTSGGNLTIHNTVSNNAGYSIDARLGIIGKSATSTTGYAFRVKDSALTDMMTVRDDGAFSLGKGASPQGASTVTIGQLAETTVSNSIAIGYNAEAAGGIAIGLNADNNQSYSQCIGGNTSNAAQYQTVIGYDADGLSGADRSIAIGASAKAAATGGIAIGVSSTAQNHCIVFGRNVGVSGTPDNSVVFGTRGGNNITYSEADSFTWYNTSDTVPNLKFRTGDNQSYWNPTGEEATFGFSTTSPTATVDINGTFRLRAATNVSGKVLTADANGNGTWQTASSGGGYSPTISVENTNGGDVDLYDDNIVRLWLDDGSSDDIELEITNYASSTSSTYHVNYTNYEGGASSARTTTVDLNQSGATSISTLDFNFTDDECMKLRIWSPRLGLGAGGESTGFPFYEITIVKSGSLYTGAPVITSVLKSTS
jgi:hypothetical protein